jgi:hypothetical protein
MAETNRALNEELLEAFYLVITYFIRLMLRAY